MNANNYHAKIVIMCRDGSISRNKTHKMLDCCKNPDIWEFLSLSLDPEIFINSTKHKRLNELNDEFETPEVLAVEIW